VRGLGREITDINNVKNAEKLFEILATPHVTLPEQRSVAETREERSEAEFQNEANVTTFLVGGSSSSIIMRVVFGTW
jgi:hypothetical protein